MTNETKTAIMKILNNVPTVDVLSWKQIAEDCGVEFHCQICEIHEHLFFTEEEDGSIARDDFSGSVIWGRLDDGSFAAHAAKAFLPNAKWLDKNGKGDF
tara:strand:+ start:25954 stop:26250 length:297 start_codon:yes stop_codon:yes gene_type:complete